MKKYENLFDEHERTFDKFFNNFFKIQAIVAAIGAILMVLIIVALAFGVIFLYGMAFPTSSHAAGFNMSGPPTRGHIHRNVCPTNSQLHEIDTAMQYFLYGWSGKYNRLAIAISDVHYRPSRTLLLKAYGNDGHKATHLIWLAKRKAVQCMGGAR